MLVSDGWSEYPDWSLGTMQKNPNENYLVIRQVEYHSSSGRKLMMDNGEAGRRVASVECGWLTLGGEDQLLDSSSLANLNLGQTK